MALRCLVNSPFYPLTKDIVIEDTGAKLGKGLELDWLSKGAAGR